MIKQITINDIAAFKSDAQKSGLSFCKNTKYFGIFVDNKIVAFAGLLCLANKVVIKNIWVPLEYRGRGYFKQLIAYFLSVTKGRRIEANCTSMSVRHFLTLGFKPIKLYKNGITQVQYENIP
jgi:hypothetical protein